MTDESKQEIITATGHDVAVSDQLSPLDIINNAVSSGIDAETIRALVQMSHEHEDRKARKAYVQAMAAFKKNPPEITKNSHVRFHTGKGVTEYDHATLDHVASVVGEALGQQGLSFHWKTDQLEGGMVRVTCVMTHEGGHSEETTLQAGADQSGGKNSIQAVGSTVCYLQRYTLLSAVGLAAKGVDNDANIAVGPMPDDKLSMLKGKIEELKEVATFDEPAFLNVFGVDDISKLNPEQWQRAMTMLAKKIAKTTEGKAA